MSSIQLKDLNKYLQKFSFSDYYAELCLNNLSGIFAQETHYYIDKNVIKSEKAKEHTASLDSVADLLDLGLDDIERIIIESWH